MIPATVHYCWFGGGRPSPLMRQCMDSWRRWLPDHEFVEWNESTFDVSANRYAREAHAARRWAFVSDVARLHALSTRGGIYLDTDVELVGDLGALDGGEAYIGLERFESALLPSTAVMAAAPGHPWIGELLGEYDDLAFIGPERTDFTPNTVRVKRNLVGSHGLVLADRHQVLDNGLTVFPSDILCLPGDRARAIHHFSGSWHSRRHRVRRRVHALLGGRL